MSDIQKTTYGNIQEQKAKCKQLVDEFISNALGVRTASDTLMESHHGKAADVYSSVINSLTDDQKHWYNDIMQEFDRKLGIWEEETKAAEQRGTDNIQHRA